MFAFDGPGQQSMLFERGVPFRYDWEAVLTPVIDTLVDAARRGRVGPPARLWIRPPLAEEPGWHGRSAVPQEPAAAGTSARLVTYRYQNYGR